MNVLFILAPMFQRHEVLSLTATNEAPRGTEWTAGAVKTAFLRWSVGTSKTTNSSIGDKSE